MPTLKMLEEYARRVEREMEEVGVSKSPDTSKICGTCGAENARDATACSVCDEPFPVRKTRYKTCEGCDAQNPIGATSCSNCGDNFGHDYEITLNEALRVGAIVRGMDLDEDEVLDAEKNKGKIIREVLASGDETIIKLLQQLPEESYGRLRKILHPDE